MQSEIAYLRDEARRVEDTLRFQLSKMLVFGEHYDQAVVDALDRLKRVILGLDKEVDRLDDYVA